ncbi:MAG: MotA/TolQ/ExbB proton channel family protein [Spirochaetales bacterium]|nr:MotA/TolQ/ExbB proton channel family protein [Spirochaetales bacterium]
MPLRKKKSFAFRLFCSIAFLFFLAPAIGQTPPVKTPAPVPAPATKAPVAQPPAVKNPVAPAPAVKTPAAPETQPAPPAAQAPATGPVPTGAPGPEATGTEESSAAQETSSSGKESLFGLIVRGGWTMVGLGLIATIICALGLERGYAFHKQNLRTRDFFRDIEEKDPADLEAYLKGDPRLISRILLQGLREGDGAQGFVRGVETTGSVELGKLERGLGLISNLGNLAPLLGFFGTVVGMRASFLQFVEKAAPTARDLAGGVEEALITTAAGLLIAIPAYMLYYLFTYITDHFSVELERATAHIQSLLQRPSQVAGNRPKSTRRVQNAENQE